jgi:hypothetical protein
MKVVVCTLMWGSAFARYGKDFLETFARYWPEETRLILVTDKPIPTTRAWSQPILATSYDYLNFMREWGSTRRAMGKDPSGLKWKPKELELGYSWRHDAQKWMPQAVAPALAQVYADDGDILVWLDADVITKRKVPLDWIPSLMGDADIIHLGRPPKWSEIGFWACRMSPDTRTFVTYFSVLYGTGDVFDLGQWHSAFVWDACAQVADLAYGLKVRNLTPHGRGHVFPTSPLGPYLEHRKGDRKPKAA